MNLTEKIYADLKTAMLAKEELRVGTLRFLIADMKNYKIEKQQDLTNEDVITLLERQVKRHRESIDGFEKGARAEMAAKEKAELEILQTYLPEQMSQDEVEKIVTAAIAQVSATQVSDMGKVMAEVSSQLKGKTDMGLVSKLVKEKLSQ